MGTVVPDVTRSNTYDYVQGPLRGSQGLGELFEPSLPSELGVVRQRAKAEIEPADCGTRKEPGDPRLDV
jgi:hypothetical protein